ncbi:MAG: hypothetical protein P8Y71_22725 [Pseudolabrys sp.]|jgi:hypothetical protein
MLIGTSTKPLDFTVLAQVAMRVTVAGSAVAMPMALPYSRAFSSSRASA